MLYCRKCGRPVDNTGNVCFWCWTAPAKVVLPAAPQAAAGRGYWPPGHLVGDDGAIRTVESPPAPDTDAWIEIYSHARVPIHTDPPPGTFTIECVAYGLAGEYRFSGQTNPRLTVAEHCVRTAQILGNCVPWIQLLGLLHDAAEGCGLRDMATPIKQALGGYAEIEARFQAAILRDLGIAPPTKDEEAIVHRADQIETMTEAARLGMGYGLWKMYVAGVRPDRAAQKRIKCHPPMAAEALFLDEYHRLRGESK